MSLSLPTELTNQLVASNLLSSSQVLALGECSAQYNTVSVALIKEGMISSSLLLDFCQQQFDLPSFDISDLDLGLVYKSEVTEKLVQQYGVLPLSLDGKKLILVTSDPTEKEALDSFKVNLGLPTSFVVSDPVKLEQTITKLYPKLGQKDTDERIEVNQFHSSFAEIDSNEGDASIVLYINKILQDAIEVNASDIHFEPYEQEYQIRYRVDGVLLQVSQPPVNLAARIAARLKVLANMDIAEKRLPQDGRLSVETVSQSTIEFRVSSLPTLWGEKIVLRLLQSPNINLDLNKLGFESEQQALFEQVLKQPQGLILVTGPTGSGKSLTLYSGLKQLNVREKNVSTAEDPVEIQLKGINQVQINTKAGLSFAKALRAFLRQDPDVIMVGEIRDLETAEIAIKAAQTGHLVLSTLHTNCAIQTINRLTNMGVPSYNLTNSVALLVAQRLVRCLCPSCKAIEPLPHKKELLQQGFTLEQLNNLILYKAIGCDKCSQGYKGRVGVYEVIKPSVELNKLILAQADADLIDRQLEQEQSLMLRQSGILKVIAGVTSLTELNRVIKVNR